jgi:hypothetical protein
VIELLVEWLKRCLDVGEVAHPADGFVDVAADVNFDAEGVTVQPGAPVARWNIRQPMRCFKAKFLKDLHLVQFLYLHLSPV